MKPDAVHPACREFVILVEDLLIRRQQDAIKALVQLHQIQRRCLEGGF